MKLVPVALALFYRQTTNQTLEVWVQIRTDDGPFHGLLEFPGGGIEPGETPAQAAVREVAEEVGIPIDQKQGKFMGSYSNSYPLRTIVLYVFLYPDQPGLIGKGEWLIINKGSLSSPYQGKIPHPNHQMIDDLYRSLYDGLNE